MIDLEEIKSRINPQYADMPGTDSHERKMLRDEIEALRQQLAGKDAEIERLSDEIGYQSQWKTEFRQQKEYAEKQLAASQLQNTQLREFLRGLPETLIAEQPEWDMSENNGVIWKLYLSRVCGEAIALPTDTSALEAVKAEVAAKAGEVMRKSVSCHSALNLSERQRGEISALPGVTLEDLK